MGKILQKGSQYFKEEKCDAVMGQIFIWGESPPPSACFHATALTQDYEIQCLFW